MSHLCLAALLLSLAQQGPTPERAAAPDAAAAVTAEVTAEVDAAHDVEVLRVTDGDTLVVLLEGRKVTLRLLSVDTEEKIAGRASRSTTKPETVFGQETTVWARKLFASLGEPPHVRLGFPGGMRYDRYGRLLCHVILPDGRDFNLLLVEEGWSPYFNKYGNSLGQHGAFVAAQEHAQAARIGIWNPKTNRATLGAVSATRPYGRLLPWWNARAQAIDGFRARRTLDPDGLLSAEDRHALLRAFERCQGDADARVTVFSTIQRFYDEEDGTRTVLLRGGDQMSALRVTTSQEHASKLRESVAEFRQNYHYVSGRMQRGPRGYRLTGCTLDDWVLAEPRYAESGAIQRR